MLMDKPSVMQIIEGLELALTKMWGVGHSCKERNVLRNAIELLDEFNCNTLPVKPTSIVDAHSDGKGFITKFYCGNCSYEFGEIEKMLDIFYCPVCGRKRGEF